MSGCAGDRSSCLAKSGPSALTARSDKGLTDHMPVSESVAPASGPEASTAGAALADPQYEGQPVTVIGGPASPPAPGARVWLSVLSLGFGIDRNGNRRSPIWTNIVFLGILLPGFALWGLYRAFATPTSVGLWV